MKATLIAVLLLAVSLAGCAQRMTVVPTTPGEIAASYSVEVRKYEKITAQLLASQSITPEIAQQAHDALKSANESLRLYYEMSRCKNVRSANDASAQPGSTQLVAAAAQALCAKFAGQPLDELAQLKLAQAALAALSQQLAHK